MKLKVIACLLVVFLLLAVFAGCDKTATEDTTDTTATDTTDAEVEDTTTDTGTDTETTDTGDAVEPDAGDDFPLAGMAVDENGDPYLLGYVGSEIASGWMSACIGYSDSLWTRAGGEFISMVSENNAELELTLMNDMIEMGPDIIWVHPTDSFAISPGVEAAREAGIPVFAIDMAVSGTDVDCFVHLSQSGMGANVGQAMVDFFSADNPAVVLEIGGSLKQDAAVLRKEGYDSVVDECDYVNIDQTVFCEWNNDLSMNAVMDAFERNPEINAIYTHSDSMINGIIEALRQKDLLVPVGEEGHIYLGSIDCDPTGVNGLVEGYVDVNAEHSPPLHVSTAANLALALLYGQEIPNEVVVGSVLRTKDTAADSWGAWDPDDVANWPYVDQAEEYFAIPTR